MEEVLLDPVESRLELAVQARVVEGAGLQLPVAARVAQHACLQRGERLARLRREGVQRAVPAASLEETEKGTTGRYVWVEHEVSIRCGVFPGNGISAAGHPYLPVTAVFHPLCGPPGHGRAAP
ncbi:hypothetical protein GCM10010406_36070 [Streptomyces thermolineatus]|uniref:Uncharacterized protein n=1 Tax=Streptomyces thermolineatus TaxID=44033 RepID=A0ABN3M6P5_9ACTN